jgi:hypothetical protein
MPVEAEISRQLVEILQSRDLKKLLLLESRVEEKESK